MVTLPSEFIATKFPGYFFNSKDEKLYSLKIDGILKPLRYYTPNPFNHMHRTAGGYYVSVRGSRKLYTIEKLRELVASNSEIPVRDPQ